MRLDPASSRAANLVGVAAYRGGDLLDALSAWVEALRLDPKNENAPGNLDGLEKRLRRRFVSDSYVLEKLRLKEELVLSRGGRHAEAVRLARDRVPEGSGGDALLALAGVQAQASAAARRDPELPEADRDKWAERYARDAVGSLRKARDQGYFKEPLRAKLVSDDMDFDPLRDRPDFREALGEPARP